MWRALHLYFLCLVLVTAFLVPDTFSHPSLNEIMPGPGSDWDGDYEADSKDDEWVEVVNTGSTPCDLGGYHLLNGPARAPVYGFSGTLGPAGFRCVYGSDAVEWESGNDQSSIGLSLNNSGDIVWLVHVTAGDTVVVDSIEYVSSQVGSDVSIGRSPDGSGEWVLFDHFMPKGGTGGDPTPSGSNSGDAAPHVLGVSREPQFPVSEDSVLITVEAGDAGGISEARLAFDINLEDGEEMLMDLLSGAADLGVWGYTILPCDVGDTVHYRVSIMDMSGGQTYWPWLGYRVRQCSLLVKINEILADPAPEADGDANRDGTRDASDDEFIELLNCGASPVDISGWVLRDGSSTRHVFDSGTVMQAGEFVTVFGGGNPLGFRGKVYTASTGSLGLANTGDEISLLDSGGGLMDFHSYGTEGGRDESMARYPDCEDHWTLPSAYGYEMPFSPHQPNDPESAVTGCTWGGIKGLYR
jgi:hypothetical protein